MALPLRNDPPTAIGSSSGPTPSARGPWTDTGGGADFQPGGPVGQMQADLAQRLAGRITGPATAPVAGERVLRFLSVAGGYVALAAGYGAVAYLFLR